jgi:general secretion pathway protein D
VATPGSIPYATTQFQQIDVGVNIELQPHVNGPNDVSMHIKVEVSSVLSTETIAGVQQPIIGQKVNEADLRMQDGEASLLGGLTSDSDATSVAGIPGITNVPVLGYLFGTHTKDREKDDIVIALVPHIIRAPIMNNGDEGILAGTERVVKVDRRSPDQPASPAQIPMNQAPVANPTVPQPVNQLPPLGRILELPPGVIPGQTTASGAYISNGVTPPPANPQIRMAPPVLTPAQRPASSGSATSGNSIEIYLAPKPDPAAGPQAAPDPNNPAANPGAPNRKPISAIRKPVDPNAPLELGSVVVSTPSAAGNQNQ